MSSTIGVMKRVREVLQDCEDGGLTMSELMARADIPKTRANEVSSALARLLGNGLIEVAERSATSRMGRRIVRGYVWISVAVVVEVEQPRPNPMALLGIFRI